MQACHVRNAQFREGFGVLSFFLSYWKPFFMHNQTFHLKAAVFSPAVTKATWEASATRKAVQKLRVSLRSGKLHPPGFPDNLRHTGLWVPSLLRLTARMNEDNNHSTAMRTRQRAFPGGMLTRQPVPNVFTHSSKGFGTFSTHHKPTDSGSSCLENGANA